MQLSKSLLLLLLLLLSITGRGRKKIQVKLFFSPSSFDKLAFLSSSSLPPPSLPFFPNLPPPFFSPVSPTFALFFWVQGPVRQRRRERERIELSLSLSLSSFLPLPEGPLSFQVENRGEGEGEGGCKNFFSFF